MHNTVVANVRVLRINSLSAGNVTAGAVYIGHGCSSVPVITGIVTTGVACGAIGYGLGVSYE